jgi:hypothetical protein
MQQIKASRVVPYRSFARNDLLQELTQYKMVVGGGFEPPKASPTDLQSVPFDHSGTPPYDQLSTLEPAEGLEPPTH